jgi:hypothetical protein
MTEKLESIEKQIEEKNKRFQALTADIKEQIKHLAEKQRAQKSAIIENKETGTIELEIGNLKTKIEGSKNALEDLRLDINAMNKEKEPELRLIGLTQAEKAKTESIQLMIEIYSLISRCIPRLADLKIKNTEYLRGLRAAKTRNIPYIYQKTESLLSLFKHALDQFLSAFPNEIFQDDSMPKPEELKKLLRK